MGRKPMTEVNSGYLYKLGAYDGETVRLDDDPLCPICRGEYDDPCIISSCGHIFCSTCIHESMRTSRKCPMCSVDIADDLTRIGEADEDGDGDELILNTIVAALMTLIDN